MKTILSITLSIVLLAWAAVAYESPKPAESPPAEPPPQNVTTEADVVGWAFDAALTYTPDQQPYIRFVWIPPYGDVNWIGAVDDAVNMACNQTTTSIRGKKFAGGLLLGYAFNDLVPDPEIRAKVLKQWDDLALDESKFHIPQIDQVFIEVDGPEVKDPKTGKVTRPKAKVKQTTKVALLAPHLAQALAKYIGPDKGADKRIDVLVTQLTRSTGGIYPADFVIEQTLTSARGKYLELRQVQLKGSGGKSAIEIELAKHKFFQDDADKSNGLKGAWIKRSGVTGKERLVFSFYGSSSKIPVLVTFDHTDGFRNPSQQFIRNLIEPFQFAQAGEWFIPLANGMVECLLTNDKGDILRVAAPDVACDYTKPDGYTKELEGAMSCLICHGPFNGYRTTGNDMEYFVGADADFFGDTGYDYSTGGKHLTREQALAIVAGRLAERIDSADGILGRARRDHVRASLSVTDYRIDGSNALLPQSAADIRATLGQPGQLKSASQLVSEKIKEIYHGYRYQDIDAQRACLELGRKVGRSVALKELREMIPTVKVGRRQDEIITLLKNGCPITRDDWDAVYPELAKTAAAKRQEPKDEK